MDRSSILLSRTEFIDIRIFNIYNTPMSLFEKPKKFIKDLRKGPEVTSVFGEERIGTNLDNQDQRVAQAKLRLDRIQGFKLAEQVNYFFERHNIQAGPTVLPAVKLRFLREITPNPDADENRVAEKLNFLARRLEREENKLANPENPLPPVGIETELPDEIFPPALKTTLPLIDIPCEPENPRLFEVNPRPTYSAKVQNEIMNSLDALGLVHHDPKSPTSLHINFGIPANINAGALEPRKGEIFLISNLFVYAFSSADRVLEKEIKKSFLLKTAKPVNKIGESKQGGKMEIERFQFRLEFRATEFNDYPTYRLLTESQHIMGMFLAHLEKMLGHTDISINQERLAVLWEEFEKEVSQFLYEVQGLEPRLVDNDRARASSVMESRPELREKCRALMTKYSRIIQEIIDGRVKKKI